MRALSRQLSAISLRLDPRREGSRRLTARTCACAARVWLTADGLPLQWAVKDSNLRRRLPADLQSAPFGHLGNRPSISDCRFSIADLISRAANEQSKIDNLQFLEPTMGIEPITYHLQGGCSAVELRRQDC